MIGTDLNTAITFLEDGNLVAIPTETVYGLAANAFNEEAVLKIYKTKNRPQFNPLIIHSNSFEKFDEWGIYLPADAQKLAEQLSPGPITYVVPTSPKVPLLVTAGQPSVAIRVPGHPLTLDLLSRIEFPLAAPSANPSMYVSPTSARHVQEQLGEQIPYILDGGECLVGLESTIVSFTDAEPKILRYGGTPVEAIETILGKKIQVLNTDDSKPLAPGMMERHYSPTHKVLLGSISGHLREHNPERCAVISFSKTYKQIPPQHLFILSADEDLDEAARNLFSALRQADLLDVDYILADMVPNEGLGYAINDRLKRASAQPS